MTAKTIEITSEEYGRLVRAMAMALISLDVLESDLSDQTRWKSANVSGTIGGYLAEIASIIEIDPSDTKADMDRLMEAFRRQQS